MSIALSLLPSFGHRRQARANGRQSHAPTRATQRARQAGGPQDRALYTCGCGCSFTASVSTSVGCPRCGTRQAW